MVARVVWKKWFWGVWDNLLRFCFLNTLFLLFCFLLLGLAKWVGAGLGQLVFWPLAVLGLTGVLLWASAQLAPLADVKQDWVWSAGWRWLRGHLWAFWWLLFWLLVALIPLSVSFYWQWFGQQGRLLPLFLLLPLVWLLIFLALMSQFFLAASVQLGESWGNALKQAALLTLDNLAAALLSGLFSLALLFLSLFPPVFWMFGPMSILFWQHVLLSVLRYKYRYRHQLIKKGLTGKELRRIPWRELLQQENECIGRRTLRNTLFPWKD